jgi:hypothetical protein
MFGGLAFLIDGRMAIGVDTQRLFVCLTALDRAGRRLSPVCRQCGSGTPLRQVVLRRRHRLR